MRNSNIVATTMLCAIASSISAEAIAAQKSVKKKDGNRPNVIFILLDDAGYGDFGCYGQTKIETPNIDALAARGVRFTDMYAGAPVSAPSRCCLMTGMHSGHAQIRSNDEMLGRGNVCAEDHLHVQGKQYSKKEFERVNSSLDRPIGEYNCRHFVFRIVLGVNQPSYTRSQLRQLEQESLSKVEYEGNTYTKYEATQVQRKLETAIRQQKDNQIIARASGNKEEVAKMVGVGAIIFNDLSNNRIKDEIFDGKLFENKKSIKSMANKKINSRF